VYALRSSLAPTDFMTEPMFECANDDSGDIVFVCATGLIGGQDVIEEYLAFGMFPLSSSFSFKEIIEGGT
jgi:hypothetical protein